MNNYLVFVKKELVVYAVRGKSREHAIAKVRAGKGRRLARFSVSALPFVNLPVNPWAVKKVG